MRLDQRPEVGSVVHLRPVTKTAGWACRSYLAATVLSYDGWPLVTVQVWPKGKGAQTVQVHADDIGLHPAKDRKSGDQVTEDRHGRKVPKPLYAKVKPIELGPGEEEMTLW